MQLRCSTSRRMQVNTYPQSHSSHLGTAAHPLYRIAHQTKSPPMWHLFQTGSLHFRDLVESSKYYSHALGSLHLTYIYTCTDAYSEILYMDRLVYNAINNSHTVGKCRHINHMHLLHIFWYIRLASVNVCPY